MRLRRSFNSAVRPILALAWVSLLPLSAAGVVVHPGFDDSSSLAKPPVNVLGRWGNNASLVAIAPNWAVTTAHQTVGGPVTVQFGSTSYLAAQIIQHPTADLRVVRLETLANAPANLADFVPVYQATADGSEVGKTAVIGGFGRSRGADLVSGSTTYGYAWTSEANTTQRWGANRVEAIQPGYDLAPPFVSDILVDDFDPAGAGTSVPFEAATATFDSGGGWFILVGSQWKVAGLNAYTTHAGESWFADNPSTAPVEPPELNGAIRLTSYYDFIQQQVVPEPTGLALAAAGLVLAGWAAGARRRRRGGRGVGPPDRASLSCRRPVGN